MVKISAGLAGLMMALVIGCTKKDLDENALLGIWIKGTNTGDTLRFFQRNGKNLMAYNASFNPTFSFPTEREYILKNNKLSLQLFGRVSGFSTISSFKWIRTSSEFEVQGIEIFPFMSSTGTYFTYRKIL